jgi:hypothetical protein
MLATKELHKRPSHDGTSIAAGLVVLDGGLIDFIEEEARQFHADVNHRARREFRCIKRGVLFHWVSRTKKPARQNAERAGDCDNLEMQKAPHGGL